MGSKRTTLGKAYGTKWGAIGNIFENTLGAWVTYWELDGDTLGTKKFQKVDRTPTLHKREKNEYIGCVLQFIIG